MPEKFFILDDSQSKIDLLSRYLRMLHPDAVICYAHSRAEAASALVSQQPFDTIFPDFNLDVYHDDFNNGIKVAEFIVKNNIGYEHAISHTSDAVAGREIAGLLHDAEYVPMQDLLGRLLAQIKGKQEAV
jgi:CheY-like chemotaxis protein